MPAGAQCETLSRRVARQKKSACAILLGRTEWDGRVAAAGEDKGADGLDGDAAALALEQQAPEVSVRVALFMAEPERRADRCEWRRGSGITCAAEQQAAAV